MKKIFVTLCVTYSIFSFLYHFVFDGVARLLLIPILFSTLSVLAFYIKAVIRADLKKQAKKYKKEEGERKRYTKKMQQQELLKEYDAKRKPLYDEARSLFASLMKKRKIRNYEIEDFKRLINDRLGKHIEYYHNYRFKNDAQEIYVKFKNFNLNEYDWGMILDFLHNLEENEPIKKEKVELKTKEVAN